MIRTWNTIAIQTLAHILNLKNHTQHTKLAVSHSFCNSTYLKSLDCLECTVLVQMNSCLFWHPVFLDHMQPWSWWEMSCMFVWFEEDPELVDVMDMLLVLFPLRNNTFTALDFSWCGVHVYRLFYVGTSIRMYTSAEFQCFWNIWWCPWVWLTVCSLKVMIVLQKRQYFGYYDQDPLSNINNTPEMVVAWPVPAMIHQISSHSSFQ